MKKLEPSKAVVILSNSESRQLVDDIKRDVEKAGGNLLRLHEGRGWESLGYDSWADLVRAEFSELQSTSTSHIYRLLDAEKVSKNVGKRVSESVARELKKAPAKKQKAILEQVEESGKPTAAKISEAVSQAREPQLPLEGQFDQETVRSLRRIGNVCDQTAKKSIEDGSILMSVGDIRGLAALPDHKLTEAWSLISGKRWPFAKAKKFVEAGIDSESTIGELILKAIARGGQFSTEVDGYAITAKSQF